MADLMGAELTAVIVTHNSAPELPACLEAILAWTRHVVVIDNASLDESVSVARRYPVEVIANPDNRGFAAAVNQGFERAETPFVLLLNPDTVALRGRDELLRAASGGASTGLLVGEDGRPQLGFGIRRLPTPAALIFECLGINRLLPSNAANRRWRALDFDLSREQDAEQPAGAFWLIGRDVWAQVGGFDERFRPVWFEDVDFAKRMRDRGFQTRYTPLAAARHAGGHSVGRMDSLRRVLHWHVNLSIYGLRHFSPSARVLVGVAATLGGVVRGCARVSSSVFRVVTGGKRPSSDDPAVVNRKSKDTDQVHLHVP